jgi:hypothetical protein
MGIIRKGILGPMVNKTGAVIGRMHRGQNVLVQLYKERSADKPSTEGQVAAQDRLGKLSSFLSNIRNMVDIGFKKMVKHNSPVNAALSYNSSHAFIQVGEEQELNYAQLVYSIGDDEGPESPLLEYEDGVLNISWYDMEQSRYCQYSDLATILIYEPIIGDNTSFNDICPRSDLNVLLDISSFIGKEVHCYICFSSADGKYQGTNVYLGFIKVDGTEQDIGSTGVLES